MAATAVTTMRDAATFAAHGAELDRILSGGLVAPVFQPIVDLGTGCVAGYEALARGPAGSPLHMPAELFGTAAALGRTTELDGAARVAALRVALEAGLQHRASLFVNVEPSGAARGTDEQRALQAEAARRGLGVVVEITERDLTARPAELLARIEEYRELGWSIALDDVGVDDRSLALMPLVRPDVIKLDMSLVHQPLTPDMARTVNAVAAEAERTGARIVAEGIETDRHLETARALGADLLQGWRLGRPGPLPPHEGEGQWTPRMWARRPPARPWTLTPFQLISGLRPVARATKQTLLELSLQLEAEAMGDRSAIVLSTFQDHRFFTPGTRRRYEALASGSAFVGALAAGLGPEPAAGVRGVSLDEAEPLRGEWDVIVLGPHFAGAFSAFDLKLPAEGDRDRRFDYAVTYDRELVSAMAVALMRRISGRSYAG